MISVAIATCNGQAYLHQQLDSILNQTRLPDEVVISDDKSTDETLGIIEDFSKTAPFNVKVIRNSIRLGFEANFIQAAEHCAGEIIFFCDQDDVWSHRKVQTCLTEFQSDETVTIVIHSGKLIGTKNKHQPTRYPHILKRKVYSPSNAPIAPNSPSFAISIRKHVLKLCKLTDVMSPSGVPTYAHDSLLYFWASTIGKAVFIPDELVFYRQHSSNHCGAPLSDLSTRFKLSMSKMNPESYYFNEIEWAFSRAKLIAERLEEHGLTYTSLSSGRSELWLRRALAMELRYKIYMSPKHKAILEFTKSLFHGAYTSKVIGYGLTSLLRDFTFATNFLPLLQKLSNMDK